jgi:hypothetical protein
MSCSPTTWTGASDTMFGETMRDPVTTIVSAEAGSTSWRSWAAVSATFSCWAGVWSVGAAWTFGSCEGAGAGEVAWAKAGPETATPAYSVVARSDPLKFVIVASPYKAAPSSWCE